MGASREQRADELLAYWSGRGPRAAGAGWPGVGAGLGSGHTQVMVEPGMMRASDADRDAVLQRLRLAHGEGRLDGAELTERVEAAVTARTVGQLGELTADLPRAPAGLRPADPADPGGRSRGAELVTRAAFTPGQLGGIAVAVVCVSVWVLSTLTAGPAFLWPASAFWVFILLRRHRRRSAHPPDRR